MSLDVDLMVTQPCSVFSRNITHNLGKMAAEVKLTDELTLYDVMWRPDEHGFTLAHEISDHLDVGWNILLAYPDHFKKFNPENGWGDYDGLCNFVYKYRNACWDYPFAELAVSR